MARIGELDQIVEGLVSRGLVAPKFVGRQVGQATIEELKNLGSNLAQSQATRQTEEARRNFQSFRPVKFGGRGGDSLGTAGGRGPAINPAKPFLVGRNPGGPGSRPTASVAFPTSKGLFLRSFSDLLGNNPTVAAAEKNTSRAVPSDIARVFQGAPIFKTLQDLQTRILQGAVDPNAINSFFRL